MIWAFVAGIIFCIFCGFALYIGHQLDLMENKFKSDVKARIEILESKIN